MSQLSDKFHAAVCTLSGDGSIKNRLRRAYSENLEDLTDAEIPQSIRHQFQLLRTAMHSVKPAFSESPVVASVRKMSATDATGQANRIVAMFFELVRDKSSDDRLTLVATRDLDERHEVDTPPALQLN